MKGRRDESQGKEGKKNQKIKESIKEGNEKVHGREGMKIQNQEKYERK